MLGLSRWAGQGGSSRTVQRFFSTVIPWATLFWVFFRQHLYRTEDVYLLAGDAVVVTKAGKTTHGLERFFSRLYGKPVLGFAFFTLSLISVQARRSFPIRVEQVVRSDAENAASKAKAAAKKRTASRVKRGPGHPKGSLHKPTAPVILTPELVRIKAMLDALLQLIARVCPLPYLVLDGHFGNHNALHLAQQANLEAIRKVWSALTSGRQGYDPIFLETLPRPAPTRTPSLTALPDDPWPLVPPLLPPAQPGGRPRAVAMRALLHTLVSLNRPGCPWAMLPHARLPQSPVYASGAQWRDAGTWPQRLAARRAEGRPPPAPAQEPTPRAARLERQAGKTTAQGGARGDEGGKHLQGGTRHIRVAVLGLWRVVLGRRAARDDAVAAPHVLQPWALAPLPR
jgi:transposase